jgi:WD40 repeat protein
MTSRCRASGSRKAALVLLLLSSIAGTACHPATASTPAAPLPAADVPKAGPPAEGRTHFDRAIALLEERTGERLSLVLSEHDYSAIYPAWLPDNRLVVPGSRGVTIVEPRSGATTTVAAKGRRAVISPDGKTMAIVSSGAVDVLDVRSGESITTLEAAIDDSDERAIQFSPDGNSLVYPLKGAAETGKLLGLYDVVQRSSRGALELGVPARRASGLTAKLSSGPAPGDSATSFEMRNSRIIATLASGATALWDPVSLELILLLAGPTGEAGSRARRALLSEDGTVATAWVPTEGTASTKGKTNSSAPSEPPAGGVIHAERHAVPVLVDALRGEVVMRLEDKQCVPFGVAMHPHEPLLAVGSLYPGFCIWDLAKHKIKRRFRIPSATSKDKGPGAGLILRLAAKMSPKMDLPIEKVAFDPTGERLTLALAHLGGIVVKLSDGAVSDGALSKDSRPDDLSAGHAATSPDRSMVAGSGNEVRVWDADSGRILRRMGQHEKHARLAWTSEGVTIVGEEGTMVRFQTDSGALAERRTRPAGFDDVKTISSAAGTLFMVSSRPGGLRALRLDEPGKVVALAWQGAADGVLAAAASADAQRIAVSAAGGLAVFDATTGAALRAIETRGPSTHESNAATHVALDDEGQLVAAIVQDMPRLWEVSSGREIPLSASDCTDLEFQPKTHLLAGSCRDKVRVWDDRTAAIASAFDNGDSLAGLFFDANGARMAHVGPKYLALVDGRTFAPLHKAELTLPAATAAFSPGARFVAVAVQNGEGLAFYRVDDGKTLARMYLFPNDEAWIVRSEEGKIEILGDVERVEPELECRVGTYAFPLEACRERLVVKGLLGQILGHGDRTAL